MIVSYSKSAEDDLERIADFIALNNPRRAASFVREIATRCNELAATPRAFATVSLASDVRRRPYRNYLIFYRVETDQIIILRILNAAQDSEVALFGEPDPEA